MAMDLLSVDTTPSPAQAEISQQNNVRSSNAVHSPSSSDPDSLNDPSIRIKSQILRDFKGASYLVDLTAEGAPFHADSDTVQAVLGRLLHHYGITSTTLLSDDDSSVDSPRFPPGGFQKKGKPYESLIHFLNAIVRATDDCLPSRLRYLRGLHFYHYGREMEETANSQLPFKPDSLGLLRSPTSQQQKLSWNDVTIIVEVKSRVSDLLQQLSTYARFYLSVNRRCSFAPAIGFDHKSLQIYFFAFHRSGLSSSGPISLRTPEGFQTVVKYMVGILSIPDDEAFGLDMTRRGDVYRINDRGYDIVRPICVRNSVCGGATAVYSLKSHPIGTQDNSVELRSRTLILADGVSKLPDRIVYKLSYKTKGHTFEGPLFSRFLGQFGIIDVVGYHICGPEEPFGNTEYLLRNASFWDVSQGETGVPEKRYLQCTAMSFECLPLLDISDKEAGIPTPAELLETILHAMIGHYNLFLGGVLHRNISHENILRLREPIERSRGLAAEVLRPVLGEDVNQSKCRGFLIGDDHSIEWRKVSTAAIMERSGTVPFMSTPLLLAWNLNQPAVHTAVDDLESFLWVLVWALVHILKEVGTTSDPQVDHLVEMLSSNSISEVLVKEVFIRHEWSDVVFCGLVREWLAISQEANLAVRKHLWTHFESRDDVDLRQEVLEWLDDYCRTVYMKYIQAGYKHLESIRRYSDWKAVVEAKSLGNDWQ